MSLMDTLSCNAQQFEFVQVIRLLRQISLSKRIEYHPDPMPVGDNADVVAIENAPHNIKVTVGLEALSGCRGIIPDYIYHELLRSLHDESSSLQSFLDVFNQRYFELLSNGLTARNALLREEQEAVLGKTLTRLSQKTALSQLYALPNSLLDQTDSSFLRFSFLLGLKTRSLQGLNQLLCEYFKVDVDSRVIGSTTYRMPAQSLSHLGKRLGRNNQLGGGLLLGKQGAQLYQALEIRIQPKSRKEYLSLLMNSHFSATFRQLVSAYLREVVDVKIYLFVKRAYIDAPIISSSNLGFRLGEANCLSPERKQNEYRKILL
ncbi:type VI secretion system baseplate subunit TssG [Marinomonas algicola]|uniref:type VI secretion system baseplate subunit TssG n=1 Tax=Marinomonas algicola TaxID=2773454 RepID=UPI00174AC267|nr:type VI secretion system baseplate subunit TssG [Marinomonas algicola]